MWLYLNLFDYFHHFTIVATYFQYLD